MYGGSGVAVAVPDEKLCPVLSVLPFHSEFAGTLLEKAYGLVLMLYKDDNADRLENLVEMYTTKLSAVCNLDHNSKMLSLM